MGRFIHPKANVTLKFITSSSSSLINFRLFAPKDNYMLYTDYDSDCFIIKAYIASGVLLSLLQPGSKIR